LYDVQVRSGPLVAWSAAWLAGRVSPDDVLDAVRGDDGPHLAAPGSLLDLLAAWRRAGEPPRLVLPVPGDVRGTPAPASFRTAALDAGEAAVAGRLGAVPSVHESAASSAPPTVTWHLYHVEPGPADHIQLGDAQQDLADAVRESATTLAAADVAGSGSGAVQDELRHARRAGERLNLPPGWPARAVALLAQAERLQAVLDLVSADPIGGAVDRVGITARADALRPLATAVRRARVAAYNAES
jgi:hypothetical protein